MMRAVIALIAIATTSLLAVAEAREMTLQIPKSIQEEHHHIHSELVEATKATGSVGLAAQELAKVLDPHFQREEQIALPPLALLQPLSARADIPSAVAAEALGMSDALRAELPRMLEEHEQIRAAVEKLRAVALAAKAQKVVQLADQLALHAQTEEQLMYPAAILVGDLLRTRGNAK